MSRKLIIYRHEHSDYRHLNGIPTLNLSVVVNLSLIVECIFPELCSNNVWFPFNSLNSVLKGWESDINNMLTSSGHSHSFWNQNLAFRHKKCIGYSNGCFHRQNQFISFKSKLILFSFHRFLILIIRVSQMVHDCRTVNLIFFVLDHRFSDRCMFHVPSSSLEICGVAFFGFGFPRNRKLIDSTLGSSESWRTGDFTHKKSFILNFWSYRKLERIEFRTKTNKKTIQIDIVLSKLICYLIVVNL